MLIFGTLWGIAILVAELFRDKTKIRFSERDHELCIVSDEFAGIYKLVDNYPAEIDSLLETLTDMEQLVITLCFGLVDGERTPDYKVTDELGIDLQKLRQIKVEALNKLRRPGSASRLLRSEISSSISEYDLGIYTKVKLILEDDPKLKEIARVRTTQIRNLALPVRISHALIRSGIDTVGQLLSMSRVSLFNVRGIGKESLTVIVAALHSLCDSVDPDIIPKSWGI